MVIMYISSHSYWDLQTENLGCRTWSIMNNSETWHVNHGWRDACETTKFHEGMSDVLQTGHVILDNIGWICCSKGLKDWTYKCNEWSTNWINSCTWKVYPCEGRRCLVSLKFQQIIRWRWLRQVKLPYKWRDPKLGHELRHDISTDKPCPLKWAYRNHHLDYLARSVLVGTRKIKFWGQMWVSLQIQNYAENCPYLELEQHPVDGM